MCSKRLHFHRQPEPEPCADGQLRHVCMCGQVRFTVSTIVAGTVEG